MRLLAMIWLTGFLSSQQRFLSMPSKLVSRTVLKKALTEPKVRVFAIAAAFLDFEVGKLWAAVKALSDILVHFWFAYLRTVCLVGPQA